MPPDLFARLGAAPGVADAVAEARAAVDKLLAHRVLRRRSAEISTEAALRDARASAALDGFDEPLDRVRRELGAGVELGSVELASAGAPGAPIGELPGRVTGAINVAAAFGEALGTFERAPRQVLARLHVLAQGPIAQGASDVAWGRPRADLLAEDPLGLGAPATPTEVAARLDGLLDALVLPTKASAIVVAAVVHAEIVVLRPFGSADGVVARAAERMVLVGRGLDPKAVTQPIVGHVETGSYAEAVRAYVQGDAPGFVVHACRAVMLGARESLAMAEALQRE